MVIVCKNAIWIVYPTDVWHSNIIVNYVRVKSSPMSTNVLHKYMYVVFDITEWQRSFTFPIQSAVAAATPTLTTISSSQTDTISVMSVVPCSLME